MRNIRRRNWFFKRIILGFAVAALVAPAAAQARVDEGGVVASSKTATIGTIGYPSPAVREAIKANLDSRSVGNLENDVLISREGQSSWPGVDPASGQSYPRWSTSTEVVSASGFDWGDAGLGAGIALGLVLLGGAAFRLTSHLGKAQTA